MKTTRAIKIIGAICFALIAIAAFTAWNSPAKGYESSIYTATPIIFWMALIFSLACGVSIVAHQIYTKQYQKNNLWVIGLTLVFVVYIAMLSLWIVRGYALWCAGDPLTHLGKIQNLISSGHIEKSNFYPIAHVYSVEISLICNIPTIIPHKYVPLIFGILSAPFMYLFAKSILPEKGQVILATVASMALLQGWYLNLTSNHLSNLAFPLALFLLVKSFSPGTAPWKILFIIMVFLFAPFHPVPTLMLLSILLTIWLFPKLFAAPRENILSGNTITISRFNFAISALLFVWAITWVSSFYVWDATIRNIHTLITEGGETHLMRLVTNIQYAEVYGYNVTEYFFKLYTGIVIYIILALIAFPILRKRVRFQSNLTNLGSLYGPLAICAMFIMVLYFLNIGFGPLRLLIYIVILCTPFVGFMLYEMLKHAWSGSGFLSKLTAALVLIILIGATMNGIMKLYPSPYIYEANWQITQTEILGMDWFLHNKDTSKELTSWSIPPGRFAAFLLTPQERSGRQDLRRLKGGLCVPDELRLPYHFGYENYSSLGEYYSKDLYLVLNRKDKVMYTEIFPRMAKFRFLPQDFHRLEEDPSVCKLYSNGGFESWYIHGGK